MKINIRPILSFSLALLLAAPPVAATRPVAVVATTTMERCVRVRAATSTSRAPIKRCLEPQRQQQHQ